MLYDREIREPLFDFLEEHYGKIRIIEEKRMGKSRADLVMVTGHALVGIEIKSDADTYARLKRQIKDYNRFFDYNIIVVGSTHGLHIKEHVPEEWGIITVEEIEGEVDFYFYREERFNAEAKIERQLPFLWRPELAHIQELNGMARYKEKSKKFVIEKILEKVPEEILKPQICEELFERDYTVIAQQIQDYRRQNQKNPRRGRKRRRK